MKILVVEDNPATQEIVRDIIDDTEYELKICSRGDTGQEQILKKEWDLFIFDIMLPGKDGFQLLKIAKKHHKFIPVIMFTALKAREKKIMAYDNGADDFINKPLHKWEFLSRIRSLLNLSLSYRQLEETQNIVITLANAVEAKDPYTRGHSDRVGHYSRKIAEVVGFSEEKAEDMYWAGILHDIGKLAIPMEILTKPGKLTAAEYEKVKKHPEISYRICKDLRTLRRVLPAIKHHHESWDGTGYPGGLEKKEIPVEARVMAVADAYDAMTSDRSYRKAMPRGKALSILKEGKDKQWQGAIVDRIIEILKEES